jgi:RNA polymerase sigma-70 factor (ECF subfamily)
VTRAKAGSADAYRELYMEFAERVRRYVRKIVQDEHLAEDVTQQVFMRIIASQLSSYEVRSDATFANWLFRVAHNLALDNVSKRTRRSEEQLELDETLEAPAIGAELGPVITAALTELRPPLREVACMHFLLGYPVDEIAAQLEKSPSAVYSLNWRARRELQRSLRGADAEPMTVAA